MNDELKIKNNELGGKMNYRYRNDEEMKDSGVEWIGKIPNEWSIKPVKYLANKNQYYPIGDGDHGSIKPEMYQDEGVPYIRVQNLSWGNELNFEGMVYISEKVNNDNKKISAIIKTSQKFYKKVGIIFSIYCLILATVYPLLFNTGFNYLYVFSLVIFLSINLLIQYMY